MLPELQSSHQKTCAICNNKIDNLAGNPAKWGTYRFIGGGYTDYVHAHCQAVELNKLKKQCSNSLANNLCSDHRDKQAGKSCLACEIERLEKSCKQLLKDVLEIGSPWNHAAVERYLLAYQEGKVPDGDCKTILDRLIGLGIGEYRIGKVKAEDTT